MNVSEVPVQTTKPQTKPQNEVRAQTQVLLEKEQPAGNRVHCIISQHRDRGPKNNPPASASIPRQPEGINPAARLSGK